MMLKNCHGSCHCGAVKFEADIDLAQSTYRCNCSICRRTRSWPTVAKPEGFRVLENHHYFCGHCGVRAFGVGNETPMGKMYGVNLMCLDPTSLTKSWRTFLLLTLTG